MKTLTLDIDETIYDDVKRFLSIFSSKKLNIVEKVSQTTSQSEKFNFEEFDEKWAGFLQNTNIKE